MLTGKKCMPCEGGTPPLKRSEFAKYLDEVKGWSVADDEKSLSREFEFKNFMRAVMFLNAVAYLAEREGHHPDFTLHGWNKARFTLSTHAIGGLSENDFILAAKIDALHD